MAKRYNNSSRPRSKQFRVKRRYNHQHVFLWLALSLVALGVIIISVYLMTGGKRSESQAGFTTHTFNEDFTTDTYKDASATTADWDTTGEQSSGEAMLYHGAWTNIQDLSIKGPQFIPGFLDADVKWSSTTVKIGPDNQPHLIFDTYRDNGAPGLTAEDEDNLHYTHWNPNFYGPGQGEWVKMDGTKGADIITPTAGPSAFFIGSGAYRTILQFDSHDLPVVAYWGRIAGHPVETYVQRWCSSPATISGATVFNAWGNLSCTSTNPDQASVDPASSCLSSMALDSYDNPHVSYDYCSSSVSSTPVASYYTRWNGVAWVKADGTVGVESIEPGVLGTDARFTQITIDDNDTVYLALFYNSSAHGVVAYKAQPYHSFPDNVWKGLDGSSAGTTVFSSAYANLTALMQINPVTGFLHFVYSINSAHEIVNKAWDGIKFVDFAGDLGFDKFTFDANDRIVGSLFGNFIFDKTKPRGWPQLLSADEFLSSHYYYWNGSAFVPHLKKTDPEEIPGTAPGFFSQFIHMDVNAEGVPFVVSGRGSGDTVDPSIMRYTPEWSDTSRQRLQSKVVDNVDEPIVSANLSWTGESRGFGGTGASAAAVPFGANGRNQFTDVDCSLSNNGGQDFFPVEYDKEFTFPTIGSNLIWSCDLDSGTKLDNPTLLDLKLDYKTTTQKAGLQIIKNTDTNGDGLFTDNGGAVTPGQEIAYQLKVANTGTAAAQNVVVKDSLPSGTAYVPNSTKVNGLPISDPGGETPPLEAGINVGAVPNGTFLQYNWQDGPGQDQLGDINKFKSQQFTNYSELEVLKAQTGALFQDERFVPAGQSLRLDDASAFLLGGSLDGALVLQDGRLFSLWYSGVDKNIYGRFFDKSGNALSAVLTLNDSMPASSNEWPSAVQLSSGDMVVVWNRVVSSGPLSQVVMRRFDDHGVPQTGEIVLADEPGTSVPFVHTDSKPAPGSKSPKNPVAVDGANNFYVGFIRIDGGGCQSARLAGFDAAGSALFPEVNLSGVACDVSQGPDLVINKHNKLAAIYPRRTTTEKRIELVMLNLSGAILSGPHNVYSTPGIIGFFKLGESAALPVDSSPDRFTFSFGLGSTNKAYMQIIDESGATTKGPTPIGTAGQIAAIKVADPESLIFILQNMITGQPRLRALDYNLNQVGGNVDLMTLGGARTQTLGIDTTNRTLWVNWAGGFTKYFGNLLAYAPQEHSLISSVYDAHNTTEYTDLAVTQDTPAGTSISYQARVGDTATPDTTWTPWTAITPGTPFSLKGRYLQYKVILDNSADFNKTPVLHDIAISQKGPITIEYKVTVNQSGGVLTNTASATATNIPSTVTASNQAQNPILPATSTRSGGEDRIDTSIILSGQLYPDNQSAKAVCLVRSDDPVDALPGSPFCSQVEAPILLTPTHNLDPRTLQEIQRVLKPADKIYLLGREKALGPKVQAALKAAGYLNQEQIGGRERRDTSRLIAEKLISFTSGTVTRAGVANAYTAADALSLSAPAAVLKPASTRFPVLLTANNELNGPVKEFFANHPKITTIYSAGGDKVIGPDIIKFLQNLPQKPTVLTFKGKNRFETTTLVAQHFFPVPAQIYAMSGIVFPARTPGGVPIDALLAGPAAAKNQAPLIYVVKNLPLPGEIVSYLKEHRGKIGLIQVIGGPAAVSNEIQQEMLELLK